MLHTRISTPQDIPRQRELWQLAFGDDGAYVDNFYTTYYRPERMLMLEENGVVQAMTAWFDTTFVIPEAGSYRAAYLYAVATHPAARGRGLRLNRRFDGKRLLQSCKSVHSRSAFPIGGQICAFCIK